MKNEIKIDVPCCPMCNHKLIVDEIMEFDHREMVVFYDKYCCEKCKYVHLRIVPKYNKEEELTI